MTETIIVNTPEDISDITLNQYIRFNSLMSKKDSMTEEEFIKRTVSLMTGLSVKSLSDVTYSDFERLALEVTIALGTESPFVNRFVLDGIEYGFIPNLDNMSTAEYVDLKTYGMSEENLHKVMAIMFRPVTVSHSFDKYEIEKYSGTGDRAEVMRQAPMNVVNGMVGFFYLLANELKNYIQASIKKEELRSNHLHSLRSGVGTQQ